MSEADPVAGVACPACGHALSRSEQRRMNSVLGSPRAIACASCGERIQWHRSLHRRMLIGGVIFRLGALVLLGAAVLALLGARGPVSAGVLSSVGLALVFCGVLGTYTPASSVFVERARSDA